MIALVTGASSGIGRDIARELAKREYDVIIVARNEKALNELKEELENKYKVKIYVKICDLQLNDNYNVLLHGKGNKLRRVPITNELKNMLLKYINAFRLNSTSYLFQGQKYQKASTKMITHIVKKYAIKSKMNKSIHPHVFRHTRAMHLLEAGLTLVDIRDILGHASIKTTEIYLKINIELKRNAILNVYKNNDSFEESSWIKDENVLKELLDL